MTDGGVIAGLGAYIQTSDTFRPVDLHPNLTPLSVFIFVCGLVSEDVLVFQLNGNFRTDVLKVVNRIGKECMTAGQIGEFFQQRSAGTSGAQLGIVVADDTDRINLHVLFLDIVAHIGKRVPAAIVFAICDQEKSFFGI